MKSALKGKLGCESEIEAPADKFYNVFRSELHGLADMCDERVSAVRVHEGHDWVKPGSIKTWHFFLDGKEETATETVTHDDANKVVTYNVFEGELMQHYKSFSPSIQVIDKVGDKPAIAKWTIAYEKINEAAPDPHKYIALALSMTRGADASLSNKA